MRTRVAIASIALIGLASCTPGAAWTTGDVIHIGIEHSAFDPTTLVVDEGDTITFVIHNGDPIPHEFILGDDEVQAVHEKGTEAHHGARPGEISIPPGATRRTTFTFQTSEDLVFACHLPGHYDYGMRGAVKVR